jgi:hypothetical protein
VAFFYQLFDPFYQPSTAPLLHTLTIQLSICSHLRTLSSFVSPLFLTLPHNIDALLTLPPDPASERIRLRSLLAPGMVGAREHLRHRGYPYRSLTLRRDPRLESGRSAAAGIPIALVTGVVFQVLSS